jgi:hypothetical protein
MPEPAKKTKRRIEVALIVAVLVAVGMGNIYYDYIPGTLYIDDAGVLRGSGTKTYNYPNGSPRIAEKYVAGFLRSTKWYRSDGTLVVESKWHEGSGDTYVIDDDGTILAKIGVIAGVPEGEATFYKRDGTIARKTFFRGGVEVPAVSQTPTTAAEVVR